MKTVYRTLMLGGPLDGLTVSAPDLHLHEFASFDRKEYYDAHHIPKIPFRPELDADDPGNGQWLYRKKGTSCVKGRCAAVFSWVPDMGEMTD